MRIIIVDDDLLICDSLKIILGAQPDIEVAGVGTSGADAVRLYTAEHPDIALLDIQMPGRSGLDAAREILEADPAARIVFLTTFSDDDYIVRALTLGTRGYLIKQDVATIAPALRAVMGGQSVLEGEVLARVSVLGQGPSGAAAADGNGDDASRSGALSSIGLRSDSLGNQSAVADNSQRPQAASDQRSMGGGAIFSPTETTAAQAPAANDAADRIRESFPTLTDREFEVVRLIAEGLNNKEIAATAYMSEGTVRNHISAILAKLALKNRTQLAIAYYRAQMAGRV